MEQAGIPRLPTQVEGLTSMMMVSSLFFVLIVTAAAGPVAAVVACAGVWIFGLATAEMRAVRRAVAAAQAEAAEAEAAAALEVEAEAAVMAEAEAVIAAARLRLERDAITVRVYSTQHGDERIERKIAVGCLADPLTPAEARGLATALIAAADAADGRD
jgi:hypothetical protein